MTPNISPITKPIYVAHRAKLTTPDHKLVSALLWVGVMCLGVDMGSMSNCLDFDTAGSPLQGVGSDPIVEPKLELSIWTSSMPLEYRQSSPISP